VHAALDRALNILREKRDIRSAAPQAPREGDPQREGMRLALSTVKSTISVKGSPGLCSSPDIAVARLGRKVFSYLPGSYHAIRKNIDSHHLSQ
jgi:hypothetical protein